VKRLHYSRGVLHYELLTLEVCQEISHQELFTNFRRDSAYELGLD